MSENALAAEAAADDADHLPRLSSKEGRDVGQKWQFLENIRVELSHMLELLLRTWGAPHYRTVIIGSLAVLIGSIDLTGEIWGGGNTSVVGWKGIFSAQPASVVQWIVSLSLWAWFISSLWLLFPLLRGHAILIVAMWGGVQVGFAYAHALAPAFPFSVSGSGIVVLLLSLFSLSFVMSMFHRAVSETRDLHLESEHADPDPRHIMEAKQDHSLRGWTTILIAWAGFIVLGSWAGTLHIAYRPHGSIIALAIHLILNLASIAALMVTLWYPQLLLGSATDRIETDRSRQVGRVMAGLEAREMKDGKCPSCNAPSAVGRAKDGAIEAPCTVSDCDGRGTVGRSCPLCDTEITRRFLCKGCGVSSPVSDHLPNIDAW